MKEPQKLFRHIYEIKWINILVTNFSPDTFICLESGRGKQSKGVLKIDICEERWWAKADHTKSE